MIGRRGRNVNNNVLYDYGTEANYVASMLTCITWILSHCAADLLVL